MATASSILIKRKMMEKLDGKFRSVDLRVAARAVASKEIELIRKRTSAGLDVSGKPFTRHTTQYTKWKRDFIRRGYAYNKRKAGGGGTTRVKAKTTAFAASRAGDFMRLTGRTFSDMYVKSIRPTVAKNGSVTIEYELDFRTPRSKRLMGYLSARRRFWGKVKSPKDIAELDKVWRTELKRVGLA